MLIIVSNTYGYSAGGLSNPTSNSQSGVYGSNQPSRLVTPLLLIKNDQFNEAYQMLLKLKEENFDEADRQNLLGFSARKLQNFSAAKIHYQKALNMDPYHLKALEYQGELFLSLNDISSAQENLSKLKAKCSIICPREYKQLKKAIETAQ